LSTPLQILSSYWGFTSFKPLQEEIIDSILQNKDTVALLSTGAGKSICFQVPAMATPGVCIVVSPLVALMTDQVQQLKSRGIKAMAIVGGVSANELITLLDNAIYGNYKFLYISPERLMQEHVRNAIRQMNVNFIAIDEAHCISQWGNDFRPSYKKIVILRELHPEVPVIALTATATPEVLEDTIAQLDLKDPVVIRSSFRRENLAYTVHKEDDKLYRINQLLSQNTGSAIVYVRSRSAAVEINDQLNSLGISSTFYHGGISASEKKDRLERWRRSDVSTMVATNAFGMGIDHPNVRFVIHVQLPDSLESYFQEAGRAGRDGNYANAVLLYNEHDKILVKKQFVDAMPTPRDLKKIYRNLNNYFQIPYGEGEFSQHNFNFAAFCKTYNLNTRLTYNSLNTLDRLGIIGLSKEFGRTSTLRFLVSSDHLLAYFEKNTNVSLIGKTILRLYTGVFDTITSINLQMVASKTGKNISGIISGLQQMERDGLVELVVYTTDASLTFILPREDDRTINPFAKDVLMLNRKKETQVNSVLRYIENTTLCRSVMIAQYFGESNAEVCGICSVCNSDNALAGKKETTLIAEKILQLLEETEMNSREITEKLTFTEPKVLHVLRLLLDAEKISRNTKNQYGLI